MPKLKESIPKLSRHIRGQAFVKISGQQIWLGRHGQPLTGEKYDRLIAEWLANGRHLPEPTKIAPALTIHELLAPYWRWAKERYTSAEVSTIRSALQVVERLYGSEPAVMFGPNALRAVRAEMVRKGWTRRQINRQISRVRALFRWAASREQLSETVYNQLRTVEPLRRGEAAERPKVKPVPRRFIRAIRHRVSAPARALIDLQLLTGARADELLRLRSIDIDQKHPGVWCYNPDQHKTAHHDKERMIFFGPRAQKILRLFMKDDSTGFLFSPKDAERHRHSSSRSHRRVNQKSNARKTQRVLGDCYTTASYRRAIHRAMTDAYPVPPGLVDADCQRWQRQHTWGPHRLRHNAGTFLRRAFGIEIASTVLGHSSLDTTSIYAEKSLKAAMAAMLRVG